METENVPINPRTFLVPLDCNILHNSPYSVQIRQNTDQNNSDYGQFSRSDDKHIVKVFFKH